MTGRMKGGREGAWVEEEKQGRERKGRTKGRWLREEKRRKE